MALWLLYPWADEFGILNVIRFITFRAAMAGVTALLIGIVIGPHMIALLQRMRINQTVRAANGTATSHRLGEHAKKVLEQHECKSGTVTMGGVLILASILFSTLLWGNLENQPTWVLLALTLGLGLLGVADDATKLLLKNHRGVSGRVKLAVQIVLGLLLGIYLTTAGKELIPVHGTDVALPFFKSVFVPLSFIYVPFVALVVTSTSNGVNLTDGLDGLASGCVIIAGTAFAILAYIVGHSQLSAYLLILHINGAGELAVFASALVGATTAFLWFNSHPAEMFMGDTGSLALGGALGGMAVLIKQELLLPIIGGIFVIEALSVVLQVGLYKYRGGKRLFLVAPIHHHYQRLGLAESKIVIRFWIVAAIFAAIGLATLKVR